MGNKKTAVFGIYTTVDAADSATDQLVRSGFLAGDVSALIPENLGSSPLGTEKTTKAPEGAATGAGSGAVLGGALGLLAGIGTLAIPGVGPLIAAGPIMAALAGVGVGGAIGGFTGALIGLGIPEYEAKRYEGQPPEGRYPSFGSLRNFRGGQASQGNYEDNRSRRHFLNRRVVLKCCESLISETYANFISYHANRAAEETFNACASQYPSALVRRRRWLLGYSRRRRDHRRDPSLTPTDGGHIVLHNAKAGINNPDPEF